MRTKQILLWLMILSLASAIVVGQPVRSSTALPLSAQYGSGVFLTASIGPTCSGPSWYSTACARPYVGEFVVTALNGEEIMRVMTNYWGQAMVNLPPGQYLVGVRTESFYPRAAPVWVDVMADRYAYVSLRLDAGPPEQALAR
jgi:hypothetical protein